MVSHCWGFVCWDHSIVLWLATLMGFLTSHPQVLVLCFVLVLGSMMPCLPEFSSTSQTVKAVPAPDIYTTSKSESDMTHSSNPLEVLPNPLFLIDIRQGELSQSSALSMPALALPRRAVSTQNPVCACLGLARESCLTAVPFSICHCTKT